VTFSKTITRAAFPSAARVISFRRSQLVPCFLFDHFWPQAIVVSDAIATEHD
jgi:hypothetical protein